MGSTTIRVCFGSVTPKYHDPHQRSVALGKFLRQAESSVVCVMGNLDTRTMSTTARALPPHMCCKYRMCDKTRRRRLFVWCALGWVGVCATFAYAIALRITSIYEYLTPLYWLPPLIYPVWATVVWYTTRIILNFPTVARWVFALENDFAFCYDAREIANFTLPIARKSKPYEGAEALVISAFSFIDTRTGVYTRGAVLRLPSRVRESYGSLVCDAFDMTRPNATVVHSHSILLFLCDPQLREDVAACCRRSGYIICDCDGLGGVVAASRSYDAIAFSTSTWRGALYSSTWLSLELTTFECRTNTTDMAVVTVDLSDNSERRVGVREFDDVDDGIVYAPTPPPSPHNV